MCVVWVFFCGCVCARARVFVCEKFMICGLRRSFSLWLPEVELLDEVWCKGEDVGKHPEGLGWVKTKIRLNGHISA